MASLALPPRNSACPIQVPEAGRVVPATEPLEASRRVLE